MAFRDLLGAATVVNEPTSVLHGVFDKSKSTGHDLLLFENLVEAPGHKIAVNLLTGLGYVRPYQLSRRISSTFLGGLWRIQVSQKLSKQDL